MSSDTPHGTRASSTPPSRRRRAAPYPASSKMIEAYLTDIAQLLAGQRWEEAEVAAVALPNLAVTLSHADGLSSLEQYQEWCRTWIVEQQPDSEYEAWYRRAGLPAGALRSLRLHRLMRTGDIGIGLRAPAALDTQRQNLVHLCSLLTRATRSWYAQHARHDQVVQANLSRLGILR